MNTTPVGNRHPKCGMSPSVLGHSLSVWLDMQSGQDSIIRFSSYTKRFGKRLRWQNGYHHQASVCFLCTQILIELRPYVELDELLVSRCFLFHDVPEGLLKRDIIAPRKKDTDDLDEYEAFRQTFEKLGRPVWDVMHRCFLLQFALDNPVIFPEDARKVMAEIDRTNRFEALAFQGIQMLDYLYYAEECCHDRGVSRVLVEVSANQIPKLDRVSAELPGFTEAAWTPERRSYFMKYT